MTLYLVHGNTWLEGYGYEEHVFGVFTTLVQAEAAKIVVEKRLQEEIENNSCIYVKDPEDVELQILEIKSDELNCRNFYEKKSGRPAKDTTEILGFMNKIMNKIAEESENRI
ncbi:MAG: hypothetical protein ACLT3T_13245 [Holdemanella porci]